jgi:hypothetical protein
VRPEYEHAPLRVVRGTATKTDTHLPFKISALRKADGVVRTEGLAQDLEVVPQGVIVDDRGFDMNYTVSRAYTIGSGGSVHVQRIVAGINAVTVVLSTIP